MFSWIIASCLQAVRLILLVAKLPLTFSALLRRSLVSLGQPAQNPLFKVQSLRLNGEGTHFRSYASRKTILNRFSRQSATSAKSNVQITKYNYNKINNNFLQALFYIVNYSQLPSPQADFLRYQKQIPPLINKAGILSYKLFQI